jgi:hypothetical protein
MRFVSVLLALALASGAAAISADRPLSAQSGTPDLSYDEFVKLSPDARRDQFVRLRAEQKAHIKRTHAERWLAANRSRLSAEQIAVTSEAIAFVTPDIYLQPNDPEIAKQQEAVKQKLACVLGRDNAQDAFVLDVPRPASSGARNWRRTIDAWFFWFSECVLR